MFLTGGSGFVGKSVVRELVRRGMRVVALRGKRPIAALSGSVREVTANLFDASALAAAMAGCDAVVHLVGIISQDLRRGVTFERVHVDATQAVVDAARRAGVGRLIHLSALGAREDAPAEYHRTKARAEAIVRGSALDWTILRPSLVHGPDGEFLQMLADWSRRRKAPWLFMPYFGSGLLGRGHAGKLQPLYVEDLANAVAEAMQRQGTIKKSYDVAGPDVMSWPELYHIAADVFVGKKRLIAPIPVWWAKILAAVVPEKLLGTNRDQILMSQEDNTADIRAFVDDFAIHPRSFETTLRAYAREVR